MSLPTEFKVAGVTYTVEEQENLIHIEEAWGRIDFFNSHIRVDKALNDDRKIQSFVHEVTHAIFLEAGYKEQDEDMINRVAIVLHQVLKDNELNFLKS
ncbi:ImmA/IrrE family metallo-endopeptidase [Lysinibacillus capsici]|uniref:ImmA/IrrE family metallo-endopeptidase n=1 Tax=Lysinibacillus capsici TaxID=2115968 RepID=UPI0028AE149E|nr:ImmA/IrrE family metallo-endopeptidase [Lysinibacillus capsici]